MKWCICPECGGDGGSSAYLGVVNPDDWDEEEFQHYLDGRYDRPCTFCGGSGKLLTADLDAKYEKQRNERDDYIMRCREDGIRPEF